MAPRTRSNRGEILAKKEILASGKAFNTQGLSSLPAEIHLEILSHIPAMPVPTHNVEDGVLDSFRIRLMTLSALSQTCRALRPVFLEQLWQRIEVFDEMQTHKGPLPSAHKRSRLPPDDVRLKPFAEELIRQLEVVTIREPGYARYVRVVNVVITAYSSREVLTEVAKAFSMLPNLHTVQMNLVGQVPDRSAFTGYLYPQIRTLCLNYPALGFTSRCPEARVVIPYNDRYFINFPKECPNLEVLGVTSLIICESDASHLKNLQDISLVTASPVDRTRFEVLRSLPRLHTIRLRIDKEGDNTDGAYFLHSRSPSPRPARVTDQMEVDERVKYAREILSGTRGDKSLKKVIVTYDDGRIETHSV